MSPACVPEEYRDELPLRGELLGIEHLRAHAAALAEQLTVTPGIPATPRFIQRFLQNSSFLQTAFRDICAGIRKGEPLTPDAEWLLDNFYVVEEQLREIEDDLPASYLQELPKLADGVPRIYRLANDLVVHLDSVLDLETIEAFISQFQLSQPLTIGEVWAVPIMLRLALVENLRRLTAHLQNGRQRRIAICTALKNWKAGDRLPAEIMRQSGDPHFIAQCFSCAEELFPDDVDRGAALSQLFEQTFPHVQDHLQIANHSRASNQVTIGNVITSMRLITAWDWMAFFERTNLAESILKEDPADIYRLMELESRDRYRHAVEDLAKHSNRSDLEVARRAVALARTAAGQPDQPDYRRHIGYWLVDDGRPALERELLYRAPSKRWFTRFLTRHPHTGYFGTLIVCWAALLTMVGGVMALARFSESAIVCGILLVSVPLTEFAILLVNWLITHLAPPRVLPKFDFQKGIPEQYRTIVVVPALLTGRREADALLQRLEMHFVANPDPRLHFALLTDFTDAPSEHLATDEALVEHARAGLRALNQRYAEDGRQPFLLLHRRRMWNAAEGVWMGWERKRGKLEEFNRLLHGDASTSYFVQEGDLEILRGTADQPAFPFVITLDADTVLPLGTARRLVATLAHPLNRPQLDQLRRSVAHGYTILQPRVSVRLADGNRSLFTQLFANSTGFDPYATAASDVYQDIFGEGSFTGKGIYDVQSFDQTTRAAFPENHILSHDLIEGCHARVGLVSDIEVVDGYPSRYDAAARRTHRWVRGDWQISPWLFPSVPSEAGSKRNPLSSLSRWKIFDNLRRSLVAPTTWLMLIVGWMVFPKLALLWSVIGALTLALPAVTSIFALLLSLPRVSNWRAFVINLRTLLGQSILQSLVVAATLPHQAVLMLDAIARTLYRLMWSRRKLLEWETAAATERRLSKSKWSALRHMWFVPVATVLIGVLMPAGALPAALPWLGLWFISPLLAEVISHPLVDRKRELTGEDRQWLRIVARNTWSFFEECVSERTNWLPPDNFQEYPEEKLAERISPTNEGLFLVSGLVARDFGFIGLHDLCGLWQRNLATWQRLPKLHGHPYNWYETAELAPLMPRYVSTVDSGNLFASFLVLQQGIDELYRQPIVSAGLWAGVSDSVEVALRACQDLQPRGATMVSPPLDNLTAALTGLKQHLRTPPESWAATAGFWQTIRAGRGNLSELVDKLVTSHRHPCDEVARRVSRLMQLLDGIDTDFSRLVPWLELFSSSEQPDGPVLEALSRVRSLQDLAGLPAAIQTAIGQTSASSIPQRWSAAIAASAQGAAALLAELQTVSETANRLGQQMDFRFLYNPQRRLFSIGFNLEDNRLDRSYYDMLCSEARLSSHLAIAKGDVPPKHWFQLGRQLTNTAQRTGLLSWGGTMFEFLMPVLFQRQYAGSLLEQACGTAVARQREYGKQTGVPWGVSESAYAALAVNADYHYQSFGVPGLGLKRGLSEDLVIAPYATMLALSVDPVSATENLHRLAEEGALGRWGFYEAMDYSPERVPLGKRVLPVRCFMAHHLGMSLMAMGNVIFDGANLRRFHSHPLVRATEMLLQESMSTAMPVIQPHEDEIAEISPPRPDSQLVSRYLNGYETAVPRTHLLSNGNYSVLLTNTGGGVSRWGEIAVNRWRADAIRDVGGQFLYLRDVQSGNVWSATYEPTAAVPDSYEVTYSVDKAEYRRRDGEWESHLEVAISSQDPAEVRQMTLTNLSKFRRTIELTSYVEVCLTTPAADLAHPAFQKLFIETEYIPEEQALLARRRPREPQKPPLWAIHVLSSTAEFVEDVQYETNRAAFLGRNRDVSSPAAMDSHAQLTGETGCVLDPILSLRCRIAVPANSTVSVTFTTGVAESREAALRLADQFHEPRGTQRAFELAWAFSQVQLQHLKLTAARAQRFQQSATYLIFPNSAARGSEFSIRNNRQSQSGLWRFGISGDWPVLLVTVSEPDQVDFVRDVIAARDYWDAHGLRVDVVILNTHPGSYLDALQEQLQRVLQEPRRLVTARTSVFLLRASQIAREDHWLLEAVAHVVIDARRGWSGLPPLTTTAGEAAPPPVKSDVKKPKWPSQMMAAPLLRRKRLSHDLTSIAAEEGGTADRPDDLEFWNGIGGFADDGREYRLHLRDGVTSPAPWSNVIANPRFGCLVTESGSGYSWFANSRENKLTSWSNDPVTDPPSEHLFLRDDESMTVWTPLRGVAPDVSRWVHHGAGYTRFVTQFEQLEHDITISIAADDPVKFVCVKLKNTGPTERKMSAVFAAELVLGVNREQTQMHIVTEQDPTTGALLARNPYHAEYPDQVVFVETLSNDRSLTGDRLQFWGRSSSSAIPAALAEPKLSGTTGAGLDPCAAIQACVSIPPGQTTEIIFLLGCGANGVETQQLLQRYSTAESVRTAMQQTRDQWDHILGAVQVKTPDRALDLLVNRWLLYQTLSCRLWGRSAFYQSGGAYGFRDQLQDTMALVYSRPDLVREHLLRAASRQYEAGDVQHWWHPPLGRGTRTKFSDDLLFLPFAVSHYLKVTGDESVLDEVQPFLDSPALTHDEHERYEFPQVSSETGTLFEHCRRTIAQSLKVGDHGLPLMGCGDWNDGMNLVGALGRGESVWVGWFLIVVIDEFAPIMERRGLTDEARQFREHAARLRTALEQHAWDGQWYLRAFYDNGTPMGSSRSDECQIDSLAQSWAVLAGADPHRTDQAMESALKQLVFPADRLVALFQPPFDRSAQEPGYIKGYLPGVRENGGQYTHAVLWLIQALARQGDGQRAVEIFDLINPVLITEASEGVQRYQSEPYVLAADVYTAAKHRGRGGWTWYTGSAAWAYRVAVESLLGMDVSGTEIQWRPCVPAEWQRFQVSYRYGNSHWTFTVEVSEAADGKPASDPIVMVDDGAAHHVVVKASAGARRVSNRAMNGERSTPSSPHFSPETDGSSDVDRMQEVRDGHGRVIA
ncbi:MAG TPA: glucoamylase family protein [Planctomycetaceae bacterium]|nr:glucoamylase family protein [Planctomycetaceae bacterium]